VTEFGAGIDPFQVDLLVGESLHLGDEGLSQSDRSSLRSNTATADHDEVLVNHTIVREATHWIDSLLGDIVFRSTILLSFDGQR